MQFCSTRDWWNKPQGDGTMCVWFSSKADAKRKANLFFVFYTFTIKVTIALIWHYSFVISFSPFFHSQYFVLCTACIHFRQNLSWRTVVNSNSGTHPAWQRRKDEVLSSWSGGNFPRWLFKSIAVSLFFTCFTTFPLDAYQAFWISLNPSRMICFKVASYTSILCLNTMVGVSQSSPRCATNSTLTEYHGGNFSACLD